MLNVQDPEILSFVPNYRINLISPASLKDEEIEKFHTSLREVLKYIKYSEDKKKITELLNFDTRFRSLERAAIEVINVTTDSKLKVEEREDTVNMCRAMREIREDAADDAIVEDLKNVMESFSVSAEQAMKALKIPEEKYGKYLARINGNE